MGATNILSKESSNIITHTKALILRKARILVKVWWIGFCFVFIGKVAKKYN